MTTEPEGRMQTMCNLSENILEEGIQQGVDLGINKERQNAIARMLKAGASRQQILSYGYTKEELEKAE